MSAGEVHEYVANGIAVTWKPSVCIHSGKCAMGLPAVFRPRSHPWIDLTQASAEEVIAQVEKCPSGALGWRRDD